MENPVEKRILEEYNKIDSYRSNDFMFRKLDWTSYEWQGALRGPAGTELEGGIYHVRLLFPKEYPWEEPSFIFLTENGSFNIETKVRLKWEPSRRVRQAFLELIELMTTCPHFNSGSVEHKEERRRLAKKSSVAAPKFGTDERQKLIDVNHQYMQRETRNTSLTQRCEEEVVVVVDRVGPTQMESDRSVIVEDKCNINNSGEKRILDEYDDIKSKPSDDFTCLKLGWKNYEWQFAIRGPRGTEFDGGIYHGMVTFSEGYPSNPPSIAFLTKNGCFDIQTVISLSRFSNWQPSLSVREILVAFIEEMATNPNGGLVPGENSREERRSLAIQSRAVAPKYGTFARQQVIDEIHQFMLDNTPLSVPQVIPVPSQASNGTGGGSFVNSIVGNTFIVNGSERVGIFRVENYGGFFGGVFLVILCSVVFLFIGRSSTA
ncbi:PREDICTED: ubiquitin-conjugating enzyme E2 J2-like [Prunus mume]|uniref:Ubiquitin-conjugating enzyme E2 J2-like n=1 Tax=Prunus mume TaxID=102107 RepID=A0ABM0PN27_PRUMU|nr:PREDICTED: ubiquitin-conjugating enzyme E2 J2-like [Prunus mume]